MADGGHIKALRSLFIHCSILLFHFSLTLIKVTAIVDVEEKSCGAKQKLHTILYISGSECGKIVELQGVDYIHSFLSKKAICIDVTRY